MGIDDETGGGGRDEGVCVCMEGEVRVCICVCGGRDVCVSVEGEMGVFI